jgi:hypothetical protein
MSLLRHVRSDYNPKVAAQAEEQKENTTFVLRSTRFLAGLLLAKEGVE